ncbi:MAG TPA: 2-oxo acid dehydrogenase subunit E2 [Bacteroidales bacterium]|nr:2-oxo acid dehydrogenase subunit E2 [Bacteroidales bacterium]
MINNYRFKKFPSSRIATFDIFTVGLKKHHIIALLEFDVTDSRTRLRKLRKGGISVSLNAWLIKVIGEVLKKYPGAASYLYNKRNLLLCNDVNVSFLVEKKLGENKVPIPLVICNVNGKTAYEIGKEIEQAVNQELKASDIVLKRQSAIYERTYYHLPGFARRLFWKILLKKPERAFSTMGNVSVTSVGMMGRINGWFIHKSVHPLSFGIGSVIRKPVVEGNEIKIRDVLNMTILIDHDVIDGAPMVRFLNELTDYIESGKFIQPA